MRRTSPAWERGNCSWRSLLWDGDCAKSVLKLVPCLLCLCTTERSEVVWRSAVLRRAAVVGVWIAWWTIDGLRQEGHARSTFLLLLLALPFQEEDARDGKAQQHSSDLSGTPTIFGSVGERASRLRDSEEESCNCGRLRHAVCGRRGCARKEIATPSSAQARPKASTEASKCWRRLPPEPL